jgi:hypothetical protein
MTDAALALALGGGLTAACDALGAPAFIVGVFITLR